MKSSLAVVTAIALAVAGGPALAQNAGQIARAKAGASCPACNLFQADFQNAELKSKNFSRARLRQADMSASIMDRTSFAGGDLRDVNAYGAVFTGANFAGADMTNASFVGTYLEGANLRGAKLMGANFSGAEMERAMGLTQAQLSMACGDDSTKLPHGLRIKFC
jgi:uncharacterized protein YjbI with pentapeptide repeats